MQVPVQLGCSIVIWGITETGLHYSFDLDESLQIRRIFEPSKVKLVALQHKIDLQIARIKAEKMVGKGSRFIIHAPL